jgi:DNA-binding transcriptional regulator YiaG
MTNFMLESQHQPSTSVQQAIVEVPRVPLLAAGAFAFGLAVGTGGAVTGPNIAELARNLQSTTVTWTYSAPARRSEEESLTPTEQVLRIQQMLSLSLSDLASILKVSRPTIYKWVRKEATPHTQNVARIMDIFKVMRRWRMYSDGRLRDYVRTPMVGGQSIVGLLCSGQLDVNKLDAAFARVADAMDRERSSRRLVRVIEAAEVQSAPDSVVEDNLIGEAGI